MTTQSRLKTSYLWPWLVVLALATFAMMAVVQIVGDATSPLVAAAHSTNPQVEAFYRRLDTMGLGNETAAQAVVDAQFVCHDVDGAAMFYTPMFVQAALDVCDVL